MCNYYSERMYDFPCPNDGYNYKLTMDELITILDDVYKAGYEKAKSIYDPKYISVTTNASVEDIDDNTKWKEVWIK